MVTVFLGGFTEAIIHAGPGNAIVLATTSPFWVVVLGRVFLGVRASFQALAGLVVGFVGVVLIVSSQLGGGSGGGERAAGMGLALAAALGWAVGTLTVKELLIRRPDIDAVGLTTGQYLAGGAVLLVISSVAEGRNGADWGSGKLWLAVAFISIVGSAVATVAYFGAPPPPDRHAGRHLGVSLARDRGRSRDRARASPAAVVLVGMVVTIAGVAVVTTASPVPPRQPAPIEPAVASATSTLPGQVR